MRAPWKGMRVRGLLDGRERRIAMRLPRYHHYHCPEGGWGRALIVGPLTVEVTWRAA